MWVGSNISVIAYTSGLISEHIIAAILTRPLAATLLGALTYLI